MPTEIAGPADRGKTGPQIKSSAVSGGINEKYRPSSGHQQTFNRAVEQT